jgi:hypothetical protein
MSGIQQMLTGGTYKPAPPTTIGQAYGGGFYAGKIAVGGGGVATHYLVVAPKASGENSSRTWGPYGFTGLSDIDGPANSAYMASLGASFQAATFCEGLTIGGYTDWYFPAFYELEVLYYFLKPSTTANITSVGSNPYAVLPEPINTNYTSGSPAQTSATGASGFRTGETNEFTSVDYWNSTNYQGFDGLIINFSNGFPNADTVTANHRVRAVRRIPI